MLELLFEELFLDGSLEGVLGGRPQELQKRRYPQAIAVALVLPHSWLPEDLACILRLTLVCAAHSEFDLRRRADEVLPAVLARF